MRKYDGVRVIELRLDLPGEARRRHCARCGRLLRKAESIRRGYGPECGKLRNGRMQQIVKRYIDNEYKMSDPAVADRAKYVIGGGYIPLNFEGNQVNSEVN